MKTSTFWVLVLLISARGAAQGDSSLKVTTPAFSVSETPRLNALLQAASRADIPILIICSDAVLLKEKVSLRIENVALGEALAEILKGTDYQFRARELGVVEVFSKLPNATAEAKLLAFRNDATWDTTMFSAMVWGNLQMQMDPSRKGFGGVLRVPEQDKALPEKIFSDVSVKSLFAWAASENKHIAWIIWPPPTVLKNTPQPELWNLIFYKSIVEGAQNYCCVALPKLN